MYATVQRRQARPEPPQYHNISNPDIAFCTLPRAPAAAPGGPDTITQTVYRI